MTMTPHLPDASNVGDLEDLAKALSEAGALVGASDHGTTKSLYAQDPDGLEFEVVWIIPSELLTDEDRTKSASIRALDLAREIAKYGREARSGVGISREPATAAT